MGGVITISLPRGSNCFSQSGNSLLNLCFLLLWLPRIVFQRTCFQSIDLSWKRRNTTLPLNTIFIKEDFVISTDEENDNVWGRGNEKDRVCMCARAHTCEGKNSVGTLSEKQRILSKTAVPVCRAWFQLTKGVLGSGKWLLAPRLWSSGWMLAYQQARMLGDASGGAGEDVEGVVPLWFTWVAGVSALF